MKHEPLRALQSRSAREREKSDAIILVQAEAHAQAVREATAAPTPVYDMDAAARVAYEAFIRQLGMKVGEKVSDASGVHRIPSWDDHKTFVKARWRTVAQAVIDAATGVQRKQLDLTSATDVKGSTDDVAEYLHNRRRESGRSNEQDIQVRGRQRAGGRATRHTTRHAGASAPRRVVAKRSK